MADFAAFCRMFNEPTGVRYVWDAENRLIEVEPGMPATGTRDPKTVFTYDHMGRRVRRQTYTWNTGTSAWNTMAATDTKYLYDGWRVIMELDGTNDEIARKYTWGLDLSGSIEGAGGIGGLLAIEDMGDTATPITGDERKFIYIYDGNGNVGQLIETTADTNYGTVQAHYEYHLYGKRLNQAAQGEYDQPYRFSTKPFDEETGLGYWGYRYYNTDLGRWMSRDPIEEKGGCNLHVYGLNAPSNYYDPRGCQVAPRPGQLVMTKNCKQKSMRDAIISGNYKACNRIWRLLGLMRTSSDCVMRCLKKRAIEVPGVTAKKIVDTLNTLDSQFCDPQKPHVFECKSDKCTRHCRTPSKPPMLTPPPVYDWTGQPIWICTDRAKPKDIDNEDNMIHEMLRQLYSGVVNQGWDYLIGVGGRMDSICVTKCGAKKKGG